MSDLNNTIGLGLTDRDLIQSIVTNYFIVDYGFINKVNGDNTVDVTHAIKPVKTNGDNLTELITKNIEVLFPSSASFSLSWKLAAGDKVLLLGLKDYVESVDDVTVSKAPEVYIHYRRATLKALPLCVFNDNAKVTIGIEDGKVTLTADNLIIKTSSLKVQDSNGSTTALEVTP